MKEKLLTTFKEAINKGNVKSKSANGTLSVISDKGTPIEINIDFSSIAGITTYAISVMGEPGYYINQWEYNDCLNFYDKKDMDEI